MFKKKVSFDNNRNNATKFEERKKEWKKINPFVRPQLCYPFCSEGLTFIYTLSYSLLLD